MSGQALPPRKRSVKSRQAPQESINKKPRKKSSRNNPVWVPWAIGGGIGCVVLLLGLVLIKGGGGLSGQAANFTLGAFGDSHRQMMKDDLQTMKKMVLLQEKLAEEPGNLDVRKELLYFDLGDKKALARAFALTPLRKEDYEEIVIGLNYDIDRSEYKERGRKAGQELSKKLEASSPRREDIQWVLDIIRHLDSPWSNYFGLAHKRIPPTYQPHEEFYGDFVQKTRQFCGIIASAIASNNASSIPNAIQKYDQEFLTFKKEFCTQQAEHKTLKTDLKEIHDLLGLYLGYLDFASSNIDRQTKLTPSMATIIDDMKMNWRSLESKDLYSSFGRTDMEEREKLFPKENPYYGQSPVHTQGGPDASKITVIPGRSSSSSTSGQSMPDQFMPDQFTPHATPGSPTPRPMTFLDRASFPKPAENEKQYVLDCPAGELADRFSKLEKKLPPKSSSSSFSGGSAGLKYMVNTQLSFRELADYLGLPPESYVDGEKIIVPGVN